MKSAPGRLISTVIAALLTACAGTPVAVGTRTEGPIATGTERTITGEACGFQLIYVIPININRRAEYAYQALEQAAGGDFITDVQVQEHWTYAFVGTVHCTTFQAKAIRAKTS